MQVTAFSTPAVPEWRWRIVNYAGDTVEASRETFPTIAEAVASGTQRLTHLNLVDPAPPPRSWRSSPRVRAR